MNENQAMFDFDGKVLESLKAFRFQPGSMKNDVPICVYTHREVSVNLGSANDELKEELPQTLKVLYSDGTIRDVPVEWDLSGLSTNTKGRFNITGKVLSFNSELTVNVIQKDSSVTLGLKMAIQYGR